MINLLKLLCLFPPLTLPMFFWTLHLQVDCVGANKLSVTTLSSYLNVFSTVLVFIQAFMCDLMKVWPVSPVTFHCVVLSDFGHRFQLPQTAWNLLQYEHMFKLVWMSNDYRISLGTMKNEKSDITQKYLIFNSFEKTQASYEVYSNLTVFSFLDIYLIYAIIFYVFSLFLQCEQE